MHCKCVMSCLMEQDNKRDGAALSPRTGFNWNAFTNFAQEHDSKDFLCTAGFLSPSEDKWGKIHPKLILSGFEVTILNLLKAQTNTNTSKGFLTMFKK